MGSVGTARTGVGRGVQTAPRVAIYQIEANKRSRALASAMLEGVTACGEIGGIFSSYAYRRPVGEIAVFYGFDQNLRRVFREYREAGKQVVLVDLGYWGRRDGGPLEGYHKVTVNDRHPTAYFQRVRHPTDRLARFGLSVRPWQSGDYVVVAGMSGKGAQVEGFRPSEWERWAIGELRKHTKREIVYRPKPSWGEATPIQGTYFAPELDGLPEVLIDCHAVVTHHSNVAIDGLVLGIPAFCWRGAASVLALQDLSRIEDPHRPEGREQFLADLAYCQWKRSEIANGTAWRHLKSEGLIA